MASSPSFTQKSKEPEETELEKILKMRKAKCSDNNNVVSWNSRKQHQLTQQRSFELPPRLSYPQGPGTTKADLLRKSTSFRHQAPPRQHQHHLQLLKPDVPIKPVTSQKMFMVSSKIPPPLHHQCFLKHKTNFKKRILSFLMGTITRKTMTHLGCVIICP